MRRLDIPLRRGRRRRWGRENETQAGCEEDGRSGKGKVPTLPEGKEAPGTPPHLVPSPHHHLREGSTHQAPATGHPTPIPPPALSGVRLWVSVAVFVLVCVCEDIFIFSVFSAIWSPLEGYLEAGVMVLILTGR